MHNLHLNNKTSSKKRVSDLFAKNLLGTHDVIEVFLGSIKSHSLWIMQAVSLLGENVVLDRLDPALNINRANSTH